jgi:hypothetical protein
MTKIVHIDARPDGDAILAGEILQVALILGAAVAILLWIQRLP